MSSLAWVDYDDAERLRARRILDLFTERESRDELGLGAIRDSIADHLFPGTSTIQTRLRYMLFLPWIFRRLEARDVPADQLAAEARAMEVRLSEALKAGGEVTGIIGRDAGARIQRVPSSIYWAGLGAWGIRLYPGSRETYLAGIPALRRHRRSEGEEGEPAGAAGNWHPAIPQEPDGLLDRASFRLTEAESGFIRDRLLGSASGALLTWLSQQASAADCDAIWEHPLLGSFPADARRVVEHAEMFSALLHGASLLYNLLLSELRGRDDWIEGYRSWLEEWDAGLDRAKLREWSLLSFWEVTAHPAHTVRPALMRLVEGWRAVALESPGQVQASPIARRIVREREQRLKGAYSRFTNRAVRDRWGGASGAERLTFRWPQARSHLKDLFDAG